MSNTSNETMSPQEWSNVAQSRSQVYGFLGALYCRLPDDQFVRGLFDPGLAGFLASVAASEEFPERMRSGAALVQGFVDASRDEPADELKVKVGVERTRLFRGVKPDYGPLPPYESVYSSAGQEIDAHPIAAVAQAYAEADAVMPADTSEQPDYIGLELDFMRHLCAKESEAWQAGDRERALDLISRERSFLTDHLSTWIPRYCDAMEADARLGLYQGIAHMTQGFVTDETEQSAAYLDMARSA